MSRLASGARDVIDAFRAVRRTRGADAAVLVVAVAGWTAIIIAARHALSPLKRVSDVASPALGRLPPAALGARLVTHAARERPSVQEVTGRAAHRARAVGDDVLTRAGRALAGSGAVAVEAGRMTGLAGSVRRLEGRLRTCCRTVSLREEDCTGSTLEARVLIAALVAALGAVPADPGTLEGPPGTLLHARQTRRHAVVPTLIAVLRARARAARLAFRVAPLRDVPDGDRDLFRSKYHQLKGIERRSGAGIGHQDDLPHPLWSLPPGMHGHKGPAVESVSVEVARPLLEEGGGGALWGSEGDGEGATISRLHGDGGNGLHVFQVGDGTCGWDSESDGEWVTHV